jgi:lysyl endopeptidase
MEDFVPLYGYKDKEVQVPVVNVLPVDLEEARELDRRNGIEKHRFGVRTDVNYSERDGSVSLLGDLAIWELSFKFSTPSQARFLIENLILPQRAKLYLYSKDSRMIIGPVTHRKINREKYHSDLIKGKKVHLKVIMPVEGYENFGLEIIGISHGALRINLRGFEDSYECHTNVICQGSAWETERNSVCLILGDTYGGSGSLINNSCEDFTPYILSAFHLADGSNNGELSSGEIDEAEDWTYRFNYESPICSLNTEPTSWLTFQGSTYRASWARTDFILMELDDEIVGHRNLSVVGWDRGSGNADDATLIHHPRRDLKKFTQDGGTAVPNNSTITGVSGVNHLVGDLLEVTFTSSYNGDLGEAEPGSSGGPWFNDDKQVVGQHRGASGSIDTSCDNSGAANYLYIGRFYRSWLGGGSSATRLSDWLAPNTSPMTLNSREVPFIAGSDHLCSGSTVYVLNNSISGRSVSWSVSPSSLFSTSSSGSGTALLATRAGSNSGPATITVEISGASGCNSIVVEKEIWVGEPISSLSITGIDPYGGVDAEFTGSGEDSDYDYKWYVDGSLEKTTNLGIASQIPGGGCGSHLLAVEVENVCGSSTSPSIPENYYTITCAQQPGNGDESVVAYPNPGIDQIQIILQPTYGGKEFDRKGLATVVIIDQLGRRCKTLSLPADNMSIDTSDLPKGIYFVKVNIGDKYFTEELMIEK